MRNAILDLNNRLTDLENSDPNKKRMTRLCSYCDNFRISAKTKGAEIRLLNEHIKQQHPNKPLVGYGPVVVREEDGSKVIIADRYED